MMDSCELLLLPSGPCSNFPLPWALALFPDFEVQKVDFTGHFGDKEPVPTVKREMVLMRNVAMASYRSVPPVGPSMANSAMTSWIFRAFGDASFAGILASQEQ